MTSFKAFSAVAGFVKFGILVMLLMSASKSHADDFVPDQLSSSILSKIANNRQFASEFYLKELYGLSRSGIVTQEIVNAAVLFDRSRARASYMGRVFSYDLDGNFEISDEEIAMTTPFITERKSAWIKEQLQMGDTNADMRLSPKEIVGLFDRSRGIQFRRKFNLQDLMEFDENADGQVTADEILSIIASAAARKVAENPSRSRPSTRRAFDVAPACTLPSPSEDAEVLYITSRGGWFVSPVAMDGQDRETSLTKLVIQPGNAPLYVVATAFDSIVWQFTGATERIEKVVVADLKGVGVVGVDGDKVLITKGTHCLPKHATQENGSDLANALAELSVLLGKQVVHTYVASGLGEILLPTGVDRFGESSGTVTGQQVFIKNDIRHVKTSEGLVPIEGPNRDRKMVVEISVERFLHRIYPGGVAKINASEVVSLKPVRPYEILPQQAGLLQLIRSGHLEPIERNKFRIVKTFSRFPAGLNGSLSVDFFLAPGVEMPMGSPGHSTVIAEDTGACLLGSRCR